MQSGQSVVLHCVAIGIPLPTVSMYHKGLLVPSEIPSERTQVQKSLVASRDTAGVYTCLASNTHLSLNGEEHVNYAQKVISVEVLGEEGGREGSLFTSKSVSSLLAR